MRLRDTKKGARSGVMKPCAVCGTEFYVTDSLKHRKHCSQKCMGISYRGTAEDFWAKVDRREPHQCWPWLASKFRKKGKQMGYGRHSGSGPYTYAHRCAWIFTHGEIPDGQLVMHKCDNVICCNPSHLRLGTDKDNSDDKIAKGRAHFQIMRAQQ